MPLQLVVPYYCWLQTVFANKFLTILLFSYPLRARVISFLYSLKISALSFVSVCTISLHSSSLIVVRYQHPIDYASDTWFICHEGQWLQRWWHPQRRQSLTIPSSTSWCSATISLTYWPTISTIEPFFEYQDYTFTCTFNSGIRHLSSSTTSCSQSGHSWCDRRWTFVLYNPTLYSCEFCTVNAWSHHHHDWRLIRFGQVDNCLK